MLWLLWIVCLCLDVGRPAAGVAGGADVAVAGGRNAGVDDDDNNEAGVDDASPTRYPRVS
jgi:hypothetical protein